MKIISKRIVFLFSIIFFFTTSCQEKENKIEREILTKALTDVDYNTSVDWLVILPGLGCTGCIQEAEFFMGEFLNNQEILFVLTKIESLKILQQKINKRLNDYSNVYYDTKGKFVVPTDNSIYPCIIELENKKIKNIEFSSPDNPLAFERIKSHLENNQL